MTTYVSKLHRNNNSLQEKEKEKIIIYILQNFWNFVNFAQNSDDTTKAFLSGSPKQLLDRQHKVQNICCSPHLLVFKIRLCPSLKKNHCGLNDCGPEWLFQLYTPSRQLQFSSGTRLFLFNLSAWKPLDSGTKKKEKRRRNKQKRKEKGDGKKDF